MREEEIEAVLARVREVLESLDRTERERFAVRMITTVLGIEGENITFRFYERRQRRPRR